MQRGTLAFDSTILNLNLDGAVPRRKRWLRLTRCPKLYHERVWLLKVLRRFGRLGISQCPLKLQFCYNMSAYHMSLHDTVDLLRNTEYAFWISVGNTRPFWARHFPHLVLATCLSGFF